MRTTHIITLVVLSGLLLTCGGADSGKTIEFWQFWTDPEARAVIQKVVDEFEANHSGVTVNVTDLTWNDGHQKIVSAFAAGRPPDLLELGSDWIAEFADQGVLLDLTPEMMRYRNQLVGWSPAIWQDTCYALPWYLGTRVLFINNNLARYVGLDVTKPPITWEQLRNWARAMRNLQPNAYGLGLNAPEKHRLYKKFLPFLWSNGGRIISEDGNFSVIDSDVAITALRFYTDLSKLAYKEKQSVLEDLFMQGRLGMVFSGDWLYKRLRDADQAPAFTLAMVPYPAPGRGGRISFAGGEYLVIPKEAGNPIGGLQLARELINEKNSINLCIATGGATPANVAAMNNPYFTEDENLSVFIRQLQSSRAAPAHPKWVYIEQVIETAVEQAMYEELTPERALYDAAREITTILRED